MKQRVTTFKDIVFKPHGVIKGGVRGLVKLPNGVTVSNVIKGGVQGLVKLPNGVTVSIVGGPTLYGDGVDTFEVASWWGDHGDWIPLGNGEDIKTYQDRHDIDMILNQLSKL